MVNTRVQLVWFKRDLRIVDHAPLSQAAPQRMGRLRRSAARAEGQEILQRHGSRKGGLRPRP